MNRWVKLSQTELYYSKTEWSPPLGVHPLTKPSLFELNLHHPTPNQTIMQLCRGQEPFLSITSHSPSELDSWFQSFTNFRIISQQQQDKWIHQSGLYLSQTPLDIDKYDARGYLYKLGRRARTWARKYCLLKDACLVFFEAEDGVAIGATQLHGYRVQTCSLLGGKRYAFELVAPGSDMRGYYFATEGENERKRYFYFVCLLFTFLSLYVDGWLRWSTLSIGGSI